MREYWKFYQSGQFVNHFSFWEDATPFEQEIKNRASLSLLVPQLIKDKIKKDYKFLDIDTTLYRITEIFEFATRLCQKNVFGDFVVIEIEMNHIHNRALFIWDYGRELHDFYVSKENSLLNRWTINDNELISDTDRISRNATVWFFERFNWLNVYQPMLEERQILLRKKKY